MKEHIEKWTGTLIAIGFLSVDSFVSLALLNRSEICSAQPTMFEQLSNSFLSQACVTCIAWTHMVLPRTSNEFGRDKDFVQSALISKRVDQPMMLCELLTFELFELTLSYLKLVYSCDSSLKSNQQF